MYQALYNLPSPFSMLISTTFLLPQLQLPWPPYCSLHKRGTLQTQSPCELSPLPAILFPKTIYVACFLTSIKVLV